MIKSHTRIIIICILLLLTLCACSKSGFPTGTFKTESGISVLVFEDDGSFTFSEAGTEETVGTYSIDGNELTWETDRYCSVLGKATYVWTFENDMLLLQLKGEDKCDGRRGAVDNIPFYREK